MNRPESTIFFALSALLVIIMVAACGYLYHYKPTVTSSDPVPLVVCTTSMLADAVSSIAGDNVRVICLMKSGVDPHTYRPSPSDIFHLVAADVILYQGLHLEGKMVDTFHALSTKKTVVAVAESLPIDVLLPTDIAGIYDPHIWHAIPLWKHVVDTIAMTLSCIDTSHAALYSANTINYQETLSSLNDWVHCHIATIPPHRRTLVTAHDAFSYFGKEYGIRVVALQGINTTVPVTMHQLQAIVDVVSTHKVPALFLETSVPLRTLMRVQEATAAKGQSVIFGGELFSDTLGNKDFPTGTYVGMIKHNVTSIVSALRSCNNNQEKL